MARPKLLLVSLGGTITMTPGHGGGIAPTLSGDDLVRAAPALEDIAVIETASPFRLPSASLTIADLHTVAELLKRELGGDSAGAIVVQGTDTIEETAFVLDLLIGGEKPVVVTGAMRGADAPGADGPANLLAAARTAVSPQARGLGVLVVLNDTIHAARFVQKTSTFLPNAFVSLGRGPLGEVVEGEARIAMRVRRRPVLEGVAADADQPVALVTVGLADDGRLLGALPGLGYRGAVIEAMGAGHVPSVMVSPLAELAGAIPVVLSSRVASGSVFTRTYGFPGSEIDLVERGLIAGGAVGGIKARLLLSLLLAAGLQGEDLRNTFSVYSDG